MLLLCRLVCSSVNKKLECSRGFSECKPLDKGQLNNWLDFGVDLDSVLGPEIDCYQMDEKEITLLFLPFALCKIALLCYYSLGVSTIILTILVMSVNSVLCISLTLHTCQKFRIFECFLVEDDGWTRLNMNMRWEWWGHETIWPVWCMNSYTVHCGCVVKMLLVGELLSLSIDANVHGDVTDDFSWCPAATKAHRYLDSLYRCHPGKISLWVTLPTVLSCYLCLLS